MSSVFKQLEDELLDSLEGISLDEETDQVTTAQISEYNPHLPPASQDLSDKAAVVLTLVAEAAGEGIVGMYLVANVIANRFTDPRKRRQFGHGQGRRTTVRDICIAPRQFSCWDDPKCMERAKREALKTSAGAMALAAWMSCWLNLSDEFRDPTNGATHYFATSIDPPSWAAKMVRCLSYGKHVFFQEK